MLRARLNDELKSAMKAKDQRAVSTVRLILAALKDRDIAARTKGNTDGIGEDEIADLLQKMVRQRCESIELYEQGMISYEDALRNADSKNEVRLRIKLESKREMKISDEAGNSLRIMEEETDHTFGR